MFTRYIAIVFAFGAAAFRASQGAWMPALGLAMLGGGLVVLKLAERRPQIKQLAYLCFLITAVAMAFELRSRLGS